MDIQQPQPEPLDRKLETLYNQARARRRRRLFPCLYEEELRAISPDTEEPTWQHPDQL